MKTNQTNALAAKTVGARCSVFAVLLSLPPAISNLTAATLYVSLESTNPSPPYADWTTAAHLIQDAVDAATVGDEIVVTNGLYATGGRAVGTNTLVNRVAVDKPLLLRSVNGPDVTIIQGYQTPGTTNGDGAIRCVYLTEGARLCGFTLTNGATRTNADYWLDQSGGGVRCVGLSAVVSNCLLTGNSASYCGGGGSGGTLNNCTLTGNSAGSNGGGADSGPWGCPPCTLNNCVLRGNSAGWGGGGAYAHALTSCTLNNCVLTGNSAEHGGGAAGRIRLNGCTITGNSAGSEGGGVACGYLQDIVPILLTNCIVYFNTAPSAPNCYWGTLNHCCTTPHPAGWEDGVGNITNAPLFVDYAGGDLRLQSNSPCINAGNNAYAPGSVDLDGQSRIVRGTVDIGAYEYQGPGSTISYAWLQQFGLPTDGSADAADLDLDGHTTWQEWRCRTDPTNALSALRLLSAFPAGDNVTVTWQSVGGVSYLLERGTDAGGPFSLLQGNTPGQAGTTSFTDTNPANGNPVLYRVGVPE